MALLALAGTLLAGQDLKKMATRDGYCQAAVPGNWEVSPFGTLAGSPDKKVSVAIGSPQHTSSFDALKSNAKKLYTKDNVLKDLAAELQMEGESMSGKPNVYRAILTGGKFCTIEVDYQSGTLADARKIAQSLKAGK